MENLLNSLSIDKIKISYNKNPIKMNYFLSLLTIEVERNNDCLGNYNGWTEFFNKDHQLIVSGGITNKCNYLDTIQYGIKKQNPYNNYVNPFALWGVLTNEGKKFFLDYYKSDIEEIIEKKERSVKETERKIENLKYDLSETIKQYQEICNSIVT